MKTAKLLPVLLLPLLLVNLTLADPGILRTDYYGWDENGHYVSDALAMSDGSYVIAGGATIWPFLMKIGPEGDSLWWINLGPEFYHVERMCETSDGGILVVGTGFVGEVGECVRAWKISTEGEKLHLGTYAQSYFRLQPLNICELESGEWLIAVRAHVDTMGIEENDDACLILTDEFGSQSWIGHYGRNDEDDYVTNAVFLRDGTVLFSGLEPHGGGQYFFLLGVNPGYETHWFRIYDLAGLWHVTDMIERENDGVALLMSRVKIGEDMNRLEIYGLRENFDIDWIAEFGEGQFEHGYRINRDLNGNMIFTGQYQNFEHDASDFWVGGCDDNGENPWEIITGDNGIDVGQALVVDEDNHYLVAGQYEILDSPFRADIIVMKLDPEPNSVGSTKTPETPGYKCTISPNPFNNIASIEVKAWQGAKIKYQIVNLAGQEILSGEDIIGSGNLWKRSFDGAGIVTGTYLLRVNVDNKTMATRVVHLK